MVILKSYVILCVSGEHHMPGIGLGNPLTYLGWSHFREWKYNVTIIHSLENVSSQVSLRNTRNVHPQHGDKRTAPCSSQQQLGRTQ